MASRQTSKPRNTLVISPGGNAPAWVETIGAPKSTPLAWVQRTAASSPAAAGGDRHQDGVAPGAGDRPVTEAQVRRQASRPPRPRPGWRAR